MTAVWGMWHGGHSYAAPEPPTDLESFTSIREAVEACEDRYANRDGRTPAVDDTSGMWLWRADPTDSDDPYPDELITRGRRSFRVMGA